MYLLALLMGQILVAYSQESKMIAIYFQLLTDFRIVKVMKHERDGELRKMRILWVSGRVLKKDLCQTTQIALASGLIAAGHDVTLASPGQSSPNNKFKHIALKRIGLRGFQSRSVAKSVKKINLIYDVIMIDWRITTYLRNWLRTSNIPWYLVDRGPPADSGILARLQWNGWKKSWKMAKQGMAVSILHAEFIKQKAGSFANIDILPAGAHIDKFNGTKTKSKKTRFIYVGKVDSNRNVENLPDLVLDVGGSLKIIGNGDLFTKMKKRWHMHDDIEIVDQIANKDVIPYLINSDIGLLPMPDNKVWRLASPLKLAEYAAAGLLVAGIEHAGNNVAFDSEWLFLGPTMKDAIKSAMKNIEFKKFRESAKRDAVKYLNWNSSISVLENTLSHLVNEKNL